MEANKKIQLVEKYMNNQLAENELDEFFSCLEDGSLDPYLEESILFQLKEKHSLDAYLPDDVSDNIIRNIYAASNFATQATNVKPLPFIQRYFKYVVAASILVVVAVSGFLFFSNLTTPQEAFAKEFKLNSTIHHSNNTSTKKEVVLEDGTKVILDPQSSISYSAFTADKRTVFLEGNAFFNVAKVEGKPFWVYSGCIITKVLGTSFYIKNQLKTGVTEVEVKTGKVQVASNTEIINTEKNNSQSIILTPNHKVLFKEAAKMMQLGLVEVPLLVKKVDDYTGLDTSNVRFLFNRASIKIVLEQLSIHYGIQITVSNNDLNNCIFTGDITEQGLFEKLKIICLSINANYELNGTEILVIGNGCKK